MHSLERLRGTLTLVLAGGQGERLNPLTRDRSKPGVPFGGLYRIIDFTLSNCWNSGLRRIYVLTQYKSYSLDKHLQKGWNIFNYEAGEFLYRIPPQFRVGARWYQGTADAIFQNFYLLDREKPRDVLVLSGDHIYRMNYGEMLRDHHEHQDDLTVAAYVVPREMAGEFGVMVVDENWKVIGFQEKPSDPATIPGDPGKCLVNMGVYVFEHDALRRYVAEDAADPDSDHDFGKNVIPAMVHEGKVHAWPFRDGPENETPYWRDIGTLDSYYGAALDLVRPLPPFSLYDRRWPVRTWMAPVPPAKIIHGDTREGGVGAEVSDSILGGGTIVTGGLVRNSILGRNVRVEQNTRIEDSVIMDNCLIGSGAVLRRTILDKDVVVPSGMVIGLDPERDGEFFTITPSGVTVVPKGWRMQDL